MCSSCGQKSRGLPGATSAKPIIFGDPDGGPAQPATFLKDHPNAKAGQYKYVSGTGVQDAVDAGDIAIGYKPNPPRAPRQIPALSSAPDWYVKTGNNRWVGFKTKPAAERYAKTVNGVVVTRDEVLGEEG